MTSPKKQTIEPAEKSDWEKTNLYKLLKQAYKQPYSTVKELTAFTIDNICKSKAQHGEVSDKISPTDYKIYAQTFQDLKLTTEENAMIDATIPLNGIGVKELEAKIKKALEQYAGKREKIPPAEVYQALHPLILTNRPSEPVLKLPKIR